MKRETHIAFVCKIDEHELVVLLASTTSNVETHSGHASGQTTLHEIVRKAELVHLHRSVLQILDYV